MPKVPLSTVEASLNKSCRTVSIRRRKCRFSYLFGVNALAEIDTDAWSERSV